MGIRTNCCPLAGTIDRIYARIVDNMVSASSLNKKVDLNESPVILSPPEILFTDLDMCLWDATYMKVQELQNPSSYINLEDLKLEKKDN